ncbi:MAG: molybdopterin molybdenumtransferase [Paenibacillus sp.]|jgi:putative molybdopterin biosynthesis protein|nr:molybdopterin molybdenumtransferase [Paenibacillus sp.]
MMRKIYLEDTPLQDAQRDFLQRITFERKVELVRTGDALGRVTAEPVFAKVSMPNYHASAMDGVAVLAIKTYGANEKNPVRLKHRVDYKIVDTGDPIPHGFDAVIMIEHIHQVDDETIEIQEPVAPWQHIRPIGEDVVAGEMIVPVHHTLRPVDLGALLAGGRVEVPVLCKPKVAIIPTGTELIEPCDAVERGEIVEFNGTVFASYLKEWGAEPLYMGIVKDEYDIIKEKVLEAAQIADFVILNAGSSAGTEDYSVHVIEELGQVFTHGVATRPGKPVITGIVEGTPVIGLPGYPVSAYLALEWFARPLVFHYYGLVEPKRNTLPVKLGRRLISDAGADDFVRMTIGCVQGTYIANPLTRAAGVTMSLVRADGILRIPPGNMGYEQGEVVEIELYRPKEQIDRTTVVTGSHDLSLDVLQTLLRKEHPDRFLVSSHVGSMSGILAIQKGEAHAAGIHLFDEETGSYNVPYVEKYLKGRDVVLIQLVYREQGWIVPKGNPLGITTVADIVRPQVTFINRQRGAGTRLLFDYLIQNEGIDRNKIYGYEREAITHLGIAAAVAGGTADVGLGIYSAALAMGVDFIPIAEERYDLLMSRSFYHSLEGKILLKVIRSESFKSEMEALGGYSCRETGQIVFEN